VLCNQTQQLNQGSEALLRKRFSSFRFEALPEALPILLKSFEAEAGALPDFFQSASASDAILKISNQNS
jgi:hypothetical protein